VRQNAIVAVPPSFREHEGERRLRGYYARLEASAERAVDSALAASPNAVKQKIIM
jgi:hypothetical protein